MFWINQNHHKVNKTKKNKATHLQKKFAIVSLLRNYRLIFATKMTMTQKFITLDEALDNHFGKVGTPERDAFESDVDEALHAYRLGEAIKKTRIEQHLTQEELGERVGVKKAQISRLERGYSITIPTMRRIFKALGVSSATIDLGIAGKVALW